MVTVKAVGKTWMVKVNQNKGLVTVAYYYKHKKSSGSTVSQEVPLTDVQMRTVAYRLLEEVESTGVQRIFTRVHGEMGE